MRDPIDVTAPPYDARPDRVDNRAAIQAALDQRGAIYVPPGVFRIADALRLKSDTRLFGEGTLLLTAPESLALLLTTGQRINVHGLTLDGNFARGTDEVAGVVLLYGGASRIALDQLTIRRAGHFGISGANATHLTVKNCRIVDFVGRGINWAFCDHTLVEANHIDGQTADGRLAEHGVEIWGKDGDQRRSQHHVLSNNTVKNVAGGGIWTASVEDITIIGNYTERCLDVCLDVEDTRRATIVGNVAKNGRNAGIATFFASEGVRIQGNDIIQDADYGPGVRIFGEGISRQVTVRHNTIRTHNSAGVFTNQRTLADSRISANHINVRRGVGISLLEADRVDVADNVLLLGNADRGLSLEGGSHCRVQRNQVLREEEETLPGNPLTHGGIYLYWRSPEFPGQHNHVTNNTVRGFAVPINDNCWGQPSTNVITGNQVRAVYYNRATGPYRGTMSGNRTERQDARLVAY